MCRELEGRSCRRLRGSREDVREEKEKEKLYEHVMTGARRGRSTPFHVAPMHTTVVQMNLKGYVDLIHHLKHLIYSRLGWVLRERVD